MIRQSEGRLVFQPLSVSFGVQVLGGSYTQHYNVDTYEYEPDRALTPLVLMPYLSINDPDVPANDGDKTGKLVNVAWTVDGVSNSGPWTSGKDYTVEGNVLKLFANTRPDTEAKVKLTADYYDNVRCQVYHNTWEQKITCASYSGGKYSLHSDSPAKLLISPFDHPERLLLNMQLMINDKTVGDDDAQYVWHVLVDGVFTTIDADNRDFWYISGVQSKAIAIDPRYVGTVFLRCTAVPKKAPSRMVTEVIRLQRFYGQYSDDLVWERGRLKFADTPCAAARVVINRKASGYLPNPMKYFDIEILYDNDNGMGWQHISHTDYGEVDRNMFPVDAQHKDRFGWQVREKTELIGVLINGAQAVAGGNPLTFQVPTIPR